MAGFAYGGREFAPFGEPEAYHAQIILPVSSEGRSCGTESRPEDHAAQILKKAARIHRNRENEPFTRPDGIRGGFSRAARQDHPGDVLQYRDAFVRIDQPSGKGCRFL